MSVSQLAFFDIPNEHRIRARRPQRLAIRRKVELVNYVGPPFLKLLLLVVELRNLFARGDFPQPNLIVTVAMITAPRSQQAAIGRDGYCTKCAFMALELLDQFS